MGISRMRSQQLSQLCFELADLIHVRQKVLLDVKNGLVVLVLNASSDLRAKILRAFSNGTLAHMIIPGCARISDSAVNSDEAAAAL